MKQHIYVWEPPSRGKHSPNVGCWLYQPTFQPHKMLVQKRLPETKRSPSHRISCDVRVVRDVSAPISFPSVLSICLWLLMIAWPVLSCFWSSKLQPISFHLIILHLGPEPTSCPSFFTLLHCPQFSALYTVRVQ